MMKFNYLILFSVLIFSCTNGPAPVIKKGECVIGQEMLVWKLLRKEKRKYLFVEVPESDGAIVHLVDDVSTLKTIECPNL